MWVSTEHCCVGIGTLHIPSSCNRLQVLQHYNSVLSCCPSQQGLAERELTMAWSAHFATLAPQWGVPIPHQPDQLAAPQFTSIRHKTTTYRCNTARSNENNTCSTPSGADSCKLIIQRRTDAALHQSPPITCKAPCSSLILY